MSPTQVPAGLAHALSCSPRAGEAIPFYPATAELLLEALLRGHLDNLPVHIDSVLNLY